MCERERDGGRERKGERDDDEGNLGKFLLLSLWSSGVCASVCAAQMLVGPLWHEINTEAFALMHLHMPKNLTREITFHLDRFSLYNMSRNPHKNYMDHYHLENLANIENSHSK